MTSASMEEWSRAFGEGRASNDGGFVGQHWAYIDEKILRHTVVTGQREHAMELLMGAPARTVES